MQKQKIDCEFKMFNWFSYRSNIFTCIVKNKIIIEDEDFNFIGFLDGKAYQHVEAIDFRDCVMTKVPQGLTKIYPNLKVIQIFRSKLRSIEQNDLKEYKDIVNISIVCNEINYLPGDLFAGMKKLEVIWFNGNKIEVIEPNLLDGLDKLKIVNFNANLCISKCFNSIKNDGNATLEEIKNEIREKITWKRLFDAKKDLEQTINELMNSVEVADIKITNLEQKNMEMENIIKLTEDKNIKMQQTHAELLNAAEVGDEMFKKLEEKNQDIINAATITYNENLKLKQSIEELGNAVGVTESENIDQTITELKNFIATHRNRICEDLKKIIEDENLKDFTVNVIDAEFKVHKFFLAARSSVLREMIEAKIDENSLNLVDISKKIFTEILNFIYTNELPKSDDINFHHLFIAAGRFKIESLKNFAAEKLIKKLNIENAFEVLTLANKYESENLRQKSFEIIKNELNEYADEVTDDMATKPEKLKIILNIKKEQEKMMQEMKLKLKVALKNE